MKKLSADERLKKINCDHWGQYVLGTVLNGFLHGSFRLVHKTQKQRFFLTFIFERQRQSVSRGGAEREGDTESEAGSRL